MHREVSQLGPCAAERADRRDRESVEHGRRRHDHAPENAVVCEPRRSALRSGLEDPRVHARRRHAAAEENVAGEGIRERANLARPLPDPEALPLPGVSGQRHELAGRVR